MQKRNRAGRRRRVSFAQILREAGPRARTAFRHARVWLWRFRRSPERKDRAAAIATFAFIALFAIGSVDAIVTGGADFDIGATAYAVEYPTAQVVRATPAPALIEAAAEETVPETVALKTADIDYSFTSEELLGGPTPALMIDLAPLWDGFVLDANKAPDAVIATEDGVL